MIRIAIIQFPGLNTEYETRREVTRAGMRGEFFRWNDDLKKLRQYDGYIIGGGFSYEDRGRAGIIAALDPLLLALKKETDPEHGPGKPILGICNGCQILVESGLIPGAEGYRTCFAMGRNKRILNNEVLGTGYYNDWVYMKAVAEKGRTAFNRFIEKDEIIALPVAHGEGRFSTTIPGLIDKLIKNQQIVFRYCDRKGNIVPEFPVNPNGSLFNIVAVTNPAGNIMGIMPHFERSEDSQTFFRSMKEYIEARKPRWQRAKKLHVPSTNATEKPYEAPKENLQFFVDLIINDNEAETFQATLRRLGFEKILLRRQTHYEITHRIRKKNLAKFLIQSGVLLNTNKERVTIRTVKNECLTYSQEKRELLPSPQKRLNADIAWLIRDRQDFIGLSKAQTLRHRFGLTKIDSVKKGTIFYLTFLTKNQKEREFLKRKLLKSNLFANPHGQEIYKMGSGPIFI